MKVDFGKCTPGGSFITEFKSDGTSEIVKVERTVTRGTSMFDNPIPVKVVTSTASPAVCFVIPGTTFYTFRVNTTFVIESHFSISSFGRTVI